MGKHGIDGDHYGAIVALGALGNMPGFCCFLASSDATPEVQTLLVQTRTPSNTMCTVRFPYSRYTHDGKWHLIAFTHDLAAGEEKLYFDGKVVVSTNATAMVNPSIMAWTPFAIGARRANEPNTAIEYPVHGRVAEVTLWNRAITAAEVEHFTHHFATDAESGLVGHWTLTGGRPSFVDTVSGTSVTTYGPIAFVDDAVAFLKNGLYLFFR